jgi:hypothetical protein
MVVTCRVYAGQQLYLIIGPCSKDREMPVFWEGKNYGGIMSSETGSSRSGLSFKAPKGKSTKPSPFPLLLSISFLLAGVLSLVFAPEEALGISLIAYLFAALGPAACLGWDSVSQRKGLKSPSFSANRAQTKILQILSLLGILIAVLNVFKVAEIIAEILTEIWGLA